MKELKLPIQAVNELYDYLSNKPYLEVHKYLKIIENSYLAQKPDKPKEIASNEQVNRTVSEIKKHNDEYIKKLAKAHGADDEDNS